MIHLPVKINDAPRKYVCQKIGKLNSKRDFFLDMYTILNRIKF